MQERLIALAEQRVHARPTSEAEARHALEWLAKREGKTLAELVAELPARGGPHSRLPG